MVVKFAKEMPRKLKLATSNHAQVSNVLEVKYFNLKLRKIVPPPPPCLKNMYDNI